MVAQIFRLFGENEVRRNVAISVRMRTEVIQYIRFRLDQVQLNRTHIIKS